jgi:hypothetical protein
VQPPAPRPSRTPVTDEPWVPPEPAPARESSLRARPADSITSMASEFNAKLSPELDLPSPPPPRPAPPAPPVREPAAVAPPPPVSPPPLPPHTDRNLAEMAQRLEAALRRPTAHDDIHPPVTDPLAASMAKPAEPPMREPRVEPKVDFTPEPRPEPRTEPKPAQAKNPFDSLEEEMASLLGRQKT